MINYFKDLFNKFRTWRKAKVEESKQPLSRENAYVFASIGKKRGHYSDVTKEYQTYVLNHIQDAASVGHTYALVEHLSYITPNDKENIVDFVASLGYSICFVNDDVVLISWKYSPNDFKHNDFKHM